MAKFSLYNIFLKSLSPGTHTFNYELDRKFFEAIDGDEVRKGNVAVEVTVKKNSSTFDFNFILKGTAQVPCSRCLEDMDQEIDSQSHLVVKFGKEYAEESDEVIIIPEDEGEINIAWFLYEFVALNIPLKHVHPPGKCEKTMSSKLRKHRVTSSHEDDETDDFGDAGNDFPSDDDDSPSNASDPRWDALKGIDLDDN